MSTQPHIKGGTGSGFHNHAGRPGLVGGSSSDKYTALAEEFRIPDVEVALDSYVGGGGYGEVGLDTARLQLEYAWEHDPEGRAKQLAHVKDVYKQEYPIVLYHVSSSPWRDFSARGEEAFRPFSSFTSDPNAVPDLLDLLGNGTGYVYEVRVARDQIGIVVDYEDSPNREFWSGQKEVITHKPVMSAQIFQARRIKVKLSPDKLVERITSALHKAEKGGTGSGNFNHAGRPGLVGGSASEQSHSAIREKYEHTVKEFVNNHPLGPRMLTDSGWSKGECDSISEDLAKYLNEKGIAAQVIGATGLKVKLPEDAHPDWINFVGSDPNNQKFLWHAVVATDDAIIDVAGSQYGKQFAGIRILSPKDFQKEWDKLSTHPNTEQRLAGDLPKPYKVKGGAGSGFFGHAGRPGLIGGSIAAIARFFSSEKPTTANELDKRLTDYKPDRSLSDPAKVQPFVEMLNTPWNSSIAHARLVHYSQMPFIDELHKAMGVRDPSKIKIEKYVELRDRFFSELPLEKVPLDNIVATQEFVNTDRVHEIRDKPETAGGKFPYLVRYDGETYVINGHHRIAGDALAFRNSIRAHVWDLDKHKELVDGELKGGVGSGFHNHSGRPGLVGGSASQIGSPSYEHEFSTLESQLHHIADFRERVKPAEFKYGSIEELILKEGEEFESKPLPKGIKQGKLGLCYMNAYQAAEYSNANLGYAEGYAKISSIPIAVAHAWNVDEDGNAVDPTWERYRREGKTITYYGIKIPMDTVRKTIFARERYGVLHNPEQGFPMLRK